jgi:hypothetical protein
VDTAADDARGADAGAVVIGRESLCESEPPATACTSIELKFLDSR